MSSSITPERALRQVQAKLLRLLDVHRANAALFWYLGSLAPALRERYPKDAFFIGAVSKAGSQTGEKRGILYYLFDCGCDNRALVEEYIDIVEDTIAYMAAPGVPAPEPAPEPAPAAARWTSVARTKAHTRLYQLLVEVRKKPRGHNLISELTDSMRNKHVPVAPSSSPLSDEDRRGIDHFGVLVDHFRNGRTDSGGWLAENMSMYRNRAVVEDYIAEAQAILDAHDV